MSSEHTSTVEIVREDINPDHRGDQVLVRKGEDYFVVSSVHTYSGFETLVFPADETGEITRYLEVAGGRGMSRAEAIEDLATTTVEPFEDYDEDDDES